ncbi:FAD-binding oxidoreductase [Limnobacter humi]|uniref:FAD-binding oxidoreductase n=1 Tax=Limnobacter humi TaxID=1778671 RepID=A0ABT1WHN7_9BURK|nr:FAD-binding oxidoreductase [Limnobacter humi]MCQ8896378.1 FAD-binding oxidoreductase [Limnobacter humi]
MTEFLENLVRGIPGLKITTDPDPIAQACTDWRKRYATTALAVVEPQTTAQVEALVKRCGEHGVAVCTQGGNTGLVGGAVPVADGEHATRPHVLLKTHRLREVLTLDEANLTLTASAGYTLHEIQEFAAAHGLLFPLSLASEGTCTLGGNLASNAGGVAVLRYGNTRELCLGLEYVNAHGERCGDLRGLRKNNTGYDLRHLLIGSEGTLGVITTACIKLYPAPNSRCVAWLHVRDIDAAVQTLNHIQQKAFHELTSFEWMNATAIDLVQKHFPAKAPVGPAGCDHVLVEFSSLGSEAALHDHVAGVLADLMNGNPAVMNITLTKNAREAEQLWALRENISEAQAKEGLNVKHDVACPVSRLPEFHHQALAAIEEAGLSVQPILFGHLGDGNLHFNLSAPSHLDAKVFLEQHQEALNDIVHSAILACGGTVSAEHGIGQLKRGLLRDITAAPTYRAFVAIKAALDPQNLFNPGKLLAN